MHSTVSCVSGAVHQTVVEGLMHLHLSDEQILSIAMRPKDPSPASFDRVFQSGLLQVKNIF